MKPILALVVPFIVTLALGIPLVLLFGQSPGFLPAYAAIPSTPEAMIRIHHVCIPRNNALSPETELGLVGVLPLPTTVTAAWIPGFGSNEP